VKSRPRWREDGFNFTELERVDAAPGDRSGGSQFHSITIRAAVNTRLTAMAGFPKPKTTHPLNDPHRQTIAHSSFEPAENNSVRFKRTLAKGKLQRDEPVWTKAEFEKHFADMDKYAAQLDTLIAELKPLRSPTYFFLGF
jgi:hypothetical protein